MNDAFVFGYGSLVNRDTHDYSKIAPASLVGWRREWRHVTGREAAFLTIVQSAGTQIEGVVAHVPQTDWPALDERERNYLRETGNDNVQHDLDPLTEIRFYHAPRDLHRPSGDARPILLSYLDVVVQGFFREFGADGVHRFFQTTDGWDAPVLDDRLAPIYPRHQDLSAPERDLTDQALRGLGAFVFKKD